MFQVSPGLELNGKGVDSPSSILLLGYKMIWMQNLKKKHKEIKRKIRKFF
jgi:hypothetical protein